MEYLPILPHSGWMLDLVAGTNPSRPVVTPAEMLENLIQLPGQLRDLGRRLMRPRSNATPRGAAGGYLGAQFGWAPLIEDLTKLVNLGDYIAKRGRELDRLAEGGMRRRLRFRDETKQGSFYFEESLTPTGSGSVIRWHYDVIVRRTTWGTIRWYPTGPIPYTSGDVNRFAGLRRIVLGLTREGLAYGAWKVIPWTWLIGWASNVGKFALANSNTVPAKHGNGNFMSQSLVTYSPARVEVIGQASHDVYQSGAYMVARKTRTIGTTVLPGVNVPYLDTFRLSILGALATQRFWR